MNNIEVCISPNLFDLYTSKDKIVVIVDILRATTIITTMLEKGARKIIPVKSLEEALNYKTKAYLIAAERDGKKVDFADFDNSPFSFSEKNVGGKTIVYSSTNGTNTINRVKEADEILIASFLNLSAISNYILNKKKDILIVLSGWKGAFCIEDSLFAGALADKLMTAGKYRTNCDSTLASADLWKVAENDLLTYIQKISQYRRLHDFGFEQIIHYCFQLNISDVLPVFKDGYISNLVEWS